MIEVVHEFCHLGDVFGSSGDVQSSVTVRIRADWRKFSDLSQVLCGRVLSLKLKGRLYIIYIIYLSCVRSVMSYGSECWAMKEVDTRRMQAAEMRMMFVKTLLHRIPNGLMRDRTGVEDIENHLVETRLRWPGYLERMDETNLVTRVRKEKFHYMKRGMGVGGGGRHAPP